MGINTPTNGKNNGNIKKNIEEPNSRNIGNVLTSFLTNDEINIINKEVPNADIRKNITYIIDELGKQICNGKNPNNKLLIEVCYEVLKQNNTELGIYPGYTKIILLKLPDWKNIAYLFNGNLSRNSNPDVLEFRKVRGLSSKTQEKSKEKPYISEENHKPSSPTKQSNEGKEVINPGNNSGSDTGINEPTIKETTRNTTKKQNTEAQYDAIKDNYEYRKKLEKIANTKTEVTETDVPLLKNNDISFSACISYDGGDYVDFTRKLPENEGLKPKVPNFDARGRLQEFTKGEDVKGKTFCIYNEIDDISHIYFFGNYGRPLINLVIKGKVSQQDAIDLFKVLQKNKIIMINTLTGNLLGLNGKNMNDIHDYEFEDHGKKVQEAVMEFFNKR